MKEKYNNILLSIKDLLEQEQLRKLKSHYKTLNKQYKEKFNELFELKYSLVLKDSKYDDLYNDDTIEEVYQEIEYEEYNTVDECKKLIEKLIIILEKLDKEIEYCNELKEKESKTPDKVDMDVVNALDNYVPLLSQLSLKELKKLKLETPKNEEMYVLLDRAIKNKKEERNNVFGMLVASLFSSSKKSNNKNNNVFNDYESFNFEEQELEEDDFHYDDLD